MVDVVNYLGDGGSFGAVKQLKEYFSIISTLYSVSAASLG